MANRYGQDGRAPGGYGLDDGFQNDAPQDDDFANEPGFTGPSFMRGRAGHHAQPAAQPQPASPANQHGGQYESDPLAELARLIGQTDPFSNFGRGDASAAQPPASRPVARDYTDYPDTYHDVAAFRDDPQMTPSAPQHEAPTFHPSQLHPSQTSAIPRQNMSHHDVADDGFDDHGAYGVEEPQWGRHPADGRIGDDDAAPIPSFLTQPREYASAQMPGNRASHQQNYDRHGRSSPLQNAAQTGESSRYDPVLYDGAPHVADPQDAYGAYDSYRGQAGAGYAGQDPYPGQAGYAPQDSYAAQGGYDPRYDNYDPNLVDPYGQPYDDHARGAGQEQGGGRRSGGMITVAAILALAVIGTLGAYAYRSFTSPSRSGSPPIIKADTTPNKIVPPKKDGENGGKAIYDRVGGAGNSANGTLVPREEAPLDVKSSASSPRIVFPPLSQPNQPPSQQAGQASQPDGIAALAAAASARLPDPAEDAKKIRTVTIRPDQPAAAASEPEPAPAPAARTQNVARSRTDANTSAAVSGGPINIAPQPAATRVANVQPSASEPSTAGGYLVQISSQRSENDARNSYRALQGKFPSVLGSRSPVIRRADLGSKGVYYRAMVGPFDSSGDASQFCSELKNAGGQCVIQRN